MKIAVCQITSRIGDLKGNFEKIIAYYNEAIKLNADICVFPELSLIGYTPQDLLEKKEFREKCFEYNNKLASVTKDTLLIFGSIIEDADNVGNDLYNCAIAAKNGKIEHIQRKTLLPYYDVFDEIRYFEASTFNQIYEYKGMKIGISICEDIWNDRDFWKKRKHYNDPIDEQIRRGAQILINISASPYVYGKREQRKQFLSFLASKAKVPIVYCCQVGANAELVFDGASLCFDSNGKIVKRGKFYEEDLFIFDINEKQNGTEPIIERSFEEEVYEAICYGVKEYACYSNFSKVVLGVSGGIDSAVVCCIAVDVFGKENVIPVLLPSMYSSKGSIDDALRLCYNLDLKPNVIKISDIYGEIIKSLQDIFSGKAEDVTEENIQSRIRGLLLMAISNKFNAMLLSCGNKSELAVGYATLYGDMCGALEPIGDVYKTDVYKLASYINQRKKKQVIPEEIFLKAPSAELKPNQKDQDTLPPYEILDEILRLYLENNMEINEISKKIGNSQLVYRVLSMVDSNEFKRKQAPPVIKISSKSFGIGRRYPITCKWRKNSLII